MIHLVDSGGQTVYKQTAVCDRSNTGRSCNSLHSIISPLKQLWWFLIEFYPHLPIPLFSPCILQFHLMHLFLISRYIVHLFWTNRRCCCLTPRFQCTRGFLPGTTEPTPGVWNNQCRSVGWLFTVFIHWKEAAYPPFLTSGLICHWLFRSFLFRPQPHHGIPSGPEWQQQTVKPPLRQNELSTRLLWPLALYALFCLSQTFFLSYLRHFELRLHFISSANFHLSSTVSFDLNYFILLSFTHLLSSSTTE